MVSDRSRRRLRPEGSSSRLPTDRYEHAVRALALTDRQRRQRQPFARSVDDHAPSLALVKRCVSWLSRCPPRALQPSSPLRACPPLHFLPGSPGQNEHRAHRARRHSSDHRLYECTACKLPGDRRPPKLVTDTARISFWQQAPAASLEAGLQSAELGRVRPRGACCGLSASRDPGRSPPALQAAVTTRTPPPDRARRAQSTRSGADPGRQNDGGSILSRVQEQVEVRGMQGRKENLVGCPAEICGVEAQAGGSGSCGPGRG